MSNSQNFITASNSKKALKKLNRALVFTLSLSIVIQLLSAPTASAQTLTLAAPVITTLRAGTTSSLHVIFNSVPNATGYQVNVYQDIDGTPLLGGSVVRFLTTQSGPFDVEVTGLTPQSFQDPVTFEFGNTFQIRVVALGDGVNYLDSAESQSWQGRTLVEPLTKFQITSGTYTWPVFTPFYLNGSGGSVRGINTFSVSNGTASGCAIREENIVSGGVTIALHNLVSTSSGTCIVSGSRSADANYSASTSDPKTVTFTKIAQAPLILNHGSGTFGTAIPLVATGGSGIGRISYFVNDGSADNCALSASGNSLVSSSAGTCFVIAIRAEDNTYLRKLSSWATFTFAKRAQTAISLTSLTAKVSTALPLTFTGGSGTGAVTFETSSSNWWRNCVITNDSLTSRGIGDCTVMVTKDGDRNYLPATSPYTTVSFVAKP